MGNAHDTFNPAEISQAHPLDLTIVSAALTACRLLVKWHNAVFTTGQALRLENGYPVDVTDLTEAARLAQIATGPKRGPRHPMPYALDEAEYITPEMLAAAPTADDIFCALANAAPVRAAHEAIARIDAMIAKDERETQQRCLTSSGDPRHPATISAAWRDHYDRTHSLRRHRARMVEAIAQVSPIPAQSRAAESPVVQPDLTTVDDGGEPIRYCQHSGVQLD